MAENYTFLPANLRPAPQAPRPRVRRPMKAWLKISAVTVICVGTGLPFALWNLKSVEVTGCEGLPDSETLNLKNLSGSWIPAVDLSRVRENVERWPGVEGVSVELKLPATLLVRALPDTICASVPIGAAWRGVTCDGALSHRLTQPHRPVLEGFDLNRVELRLALATGARLCDGTNGLLLGVRKITPSDFEITIGGVRPEASSIIKVLPRGSSSEQWWRQAAASGRVPAWADLRCDHHVVVRRAG